MKSLIFAISLIATPLLAQAQVATIEVRGNVELQTAEGGTMTLRNGVGTVSVGIANPLGAIFSALKRTRILEIRTEEKSVLFRIPRALYNLEDGTFQVTQAHSGQNASVSLTLNKVNQQVNSYAKTISCSYQISNPNNICDDRGRCTGLTTEPYANGRMRVHVLKEEWQEQQVIRITTPTGSAQVMGPYQNKARETTLRHLSRCS